MIQEITDKYKSFHDATIDKITYQRTINDEGFIIVNINAMNFKNNFEFEKVEITLKGIRSFRLVESFPYSSLIITAAVIIEEEGLITVDFFPDIYKDKLVINEDSDFIVKCNSITVGCL